MGGREVGMVMVILSWTVGSSVTALSLVYLILNIKLRNIRLIKMSSPNLNILVVSGGLLSSVTCMLFSVDYFIADDKQQVSNICQLRAALLSCSFSLLYGPLLAKCWRVNRIFEQASLKRVVIRDNRLFMFISMLLVSDIVVMSIWQTIDPLQFTTTAHLSQIIGESNVNLTSLSIIKVKTCTCSYITTWLTVIVFVKAPILLAGLVLAWKTRDVMLPSMNDCFGIIVSTLTTIIVSSTGLIISSIYQSHPDVVYSCLIIGIGICSIVTTSVTVVPKLLLWWRNPEKVDIRVSMSARSMNSVNSLLSIEQFEDDMFNVVAENRCMKKSLQEKDVSINELQRHLSNAQNKLMEISLDHETRQDSGLDIDLSSSSGQDDSDANTSGLSARDQTSHKNKNSNPQSLPAVSLLVENENIRQPSLKSYNSSASMTGYQLCRLRDSIAEDLTLARNASSDIRTSLYKDIDKVERVSKRRSFKYESMKSRQELAGSIARSYNLDDDISDTYYYVSNCVTSSSNLRNYKRNAQYSSSESIDTLPNDRLYPENKRRKKLRRQPVYTISTNPRIVQSAFILSKRLDTDTFA